MNETSVIQVEVYAEDADEAFGVIEGALAGAGILCDGPGCYNSWNPEGESDEYNRMPERKEEE